MVRVQTSTRNQEICLVYLNILYHNSCGWCNWMTKLAKGGQNKQRLDDRKLSKIRMPSFDIYTCTCTCTGNRHTSNVLEGGFKFQRFCQPQDTTSTTGCDVSRCRKHYRYDTNNEINVCWSNFFRNQHVKQLDTIDDCSVPTF